MVQPVEARRADADLLAPRHKPSHRHRAWALAHGVPYTPSPYKLEPCASLEAHLSKASTSEANAKNFSA